MQEPPVLELPTDLWLLLVTEPFALEFVYGVNVLDHEFLVFVDVLEALIEDPFRADEEESVQVIIQFVQLDYNNLQEQPEHLITAKIFSVDVYAIKRLKIALLGAIRNELLL